MDATTDKLPDFVLKAPADFWWTVKVPVATDGDYAFLALDLQFAALPQSEIDHMRGLAPPADEQAAADGDGGAAPAPKPPPTDDQIARRVVKGWRRVRDEDGDELPFSAAAFDRLLQVPMARAAITATFLAASSGLAARKNA